MAKIYQHLTLNDWRSVVFSDEATIYSERTQTSVRWVRMGDEGPPPEQEDLRNKAINVWGYIRYDGQGEIFRFDYTMRKEEYLATLQEHLLDATEPLNGRGERLIFQHDGASYHGAKIIKDWIALSPIKFLPWPPQSPDINIIENVWASIKNELWKQIAEIKSSNDIWEKTYQIFNNLTLEYIHKLYSSLPKRMKAIIDKHGNRINY